MVMQSNKGHINTPRCGRIISNGRTCVLLKVDNESITLHSSSSSLLKRPCTVFRMFNKDFRERVSALNCGKFMFHSEHRASVSH